MQPAARWLALVALLLLTARAEGGRKIRKYEKSEESVAGGTAWRIKTAHGPVYVWIPQGYERESAGLVVYIHGYHTDVDGAWKRHKLPQQFKKSRQNAMFIVPEAPRSNDDRIYWSALGDLKKHVSRGGNIRLPDGPAIIIGHSGAFRTIAAWVDNRLLAEVILLDALYGKKAEFKKFIHSGKRAKHHKLIIVATDTIANAKAFARQFRYAAVRKNIPKSYDGFTKRERSSKLLYIRSQYGHSDLVTGGKVIPLLLRLTPLERL